MDRPALPVLPSAHPQARIYTEMITTAAMLHEDRTRLLA
jgi:hypothetical protein